MILSSKFNSSNFLPQMDFNLTTIDNRSIASYLEIPKLVVNPLVTLASITSGCIAARVEEFVVKKFLLYEILKISIAGVGGGESRYPEIVTDSRSPRNRESETRIDVNYYEDVKLVENAGKSGRKSGKGKPKKGSESGKKDDDATRRKEEREEEEERLRKWNDDWAEKLRAREELDEIPCCSTTGLVLKPKTQSNVWIKVTKDKMTQDVQMAFMRVPVPKPKAPPLPKSTKTEVMIPATSPQKVTGKGVKKKGKGKVKKK